MAGELILVVDDDTNIRNIVQHFLSGAGYKVLCASGWGDAHEVLQGIVPDLILLDIMMPNATGFDIARKVKDAPEFAHVPILFLSARKSDEAKREAKESGGTVYLEKPFKKEVLEEAVRVALAAAPSPVSTDPARLQPRSHPRGPEDGD